MSLSILLTGKNGQVGRELQPLLARLGSVTAVGHQELDLAKPDDIRQVIREIRPRIIVNAAAYTAVDRAESDEAAAHAVNATAPGIMAEEAKRFGALIVHYSTDYVFDGSKRTPYVEEDSPSPQNVYGRTKLAGERAVQQSGASHLIFRTAWVYAREGRNFMLTILHLATQKEELSVVNDQFGSPTWSHEIAAATASILSDLCARPGGPASGAEARGIYHLTAAGETSWYHFAPAVLHEATSGARSEPWFTAAVGQGVVIAQRIVPLATHQYPTPARRPAYSVLSNERVRKAFGVTLPDWRVQLRSVFGAPAPESMPRTGTVAPKRLSS